jgi:hypothetical protein
VKTGAHLRIREFGDNVLGVELEGNPRKPEPIEFRVIFPGGVVEIARCSDGTYWAHIARFLSDRADGGRCDERPIGTILEARADATGHHAPQTREELATVLESDGLHHVAVRIGVRP